MKTRLEKWARQEFDPPPSKQTLNRMARNGDIPNCVKVGKFWYVEQSPLLSKIMNA